MAQASFLDQALKYMIPLPKFQPPGSAAPILKQDRLQTGDLVLLQGVHVETKRASYVSLVSTDGFASPGLQTIRVADWVADSTLDVRDCLFQITPKMQTST